MVKRIIPDIRIINANLEIYEILEMTGFTDMIKVQKAFRVLSVEGCEVIGSGSNGKVYRYDREIIIKVFRESDALPQIERERELARKAFVAGIPTAIPFDVVRIENGGYGMVFELLDAASLAELLISGEKTVDETAQMSIDLLRLIHSQKSKPGLLPNMKRTALGWAEFLEDFLPKTQYGKLRALIEDVPETTSILHGDFHIKNILHHDGECLLMDTLCCGHPVFELASMYNAYCGYGETDYSVIENYMGIPWETATAFWRKSLDLYLGSVDAETVRDVENKARLIGFVRMMRRKIRRNGLNTDEGRAEIRYCEDVISELLTKVDSLVF